MLLTLARRVFGTVKDRYIKNFSKIVSQINSLEASIEALSDEKLKAQTDKFKQELANGKTLDDILPEAFATVREAARRSLGQRHFDVQLMGGIALHQAMIAEMRTGEGKTLTLTLAAYLNALPGKGVHVVTVNDYLAKRDAEWMGKVYTTLGLTVGCIYSSMEDEDRKKAYEADITYGTNNEFGFDYLRDNMKYLPEHMVQRGFNFAIIDEVDSILIDEARTPLIISGPTDDNSELYNKIDYIVRQLNKELIEIDEKSRSSTLTEEGNTEAEKLLKEAAIISPESHLYDIENVHIVDHLNQSIKAHYLFHKDIDYLVQDGKVYIIDEFTGRVMEGRRYGEGLHQALEAKEKVAIQNENQTLASITFQNYFRLYPKLAGMTGTAMTEAQEFQDIYKLQVVTIPTNLPVKRVDEEDEIYRTAQEKYEAIIKLIEEAHARSQPILVGTVSIEKSEFLSSLLKKKKIPHHVLNAKYHQQEAEIIAQAGRPGAVTIATNMAGRGTDIMLGGNASMLFTKEGENVSEIEIIQQVEKDKERVLESGGLLVIGTERHESRRIDNQLRGRSGRQGDPGRTKFFLSLEDDLMRIFGSDRISSMLQKLGLKEGEAIVHPWISKALEKAQQKVEGRNYDIRKNLLRFDDVMNEQRKVIYEQRLNVISSNDVSAGIYDMIDQLVEKTVRKYAPPGSENYDVEGLKHYIHRIFNLELPIAEWLEGEEDLTVKLANFIRDDYRQREEQYGAEIMRMIEKRFMLVILDQLWKDHLLMLDHLRQGIGLRAYGQRDPLNEYKQEAFKMFEAMLDNLQLIILERLFHAEIKFSPALTSEEEPDNMQLIHPQANLQEERRNILEKMQQKATPSISRNALCFCGSGKKFKYCHGKLA